MVGGPDTDFPQSFTEVVIEYLSPADAKTT